MNKTDKQQYDDFKQKYPDAILLFRGRDEYKAYADDAQAVSSTCGLAVTTDISEKIDVTAFPHSSLDIFLPKLVRKGYRIAICDSINKQNH